MVKTNAARVLDGLGIKYELRAYEVDPNDLSAETVAAKVGLPAEQVFKTLAVRGDRNGIHLAVVPASEDLDFKDLRCNLNIRRHEGTANLAGPRRLHPRR